MYLVKLNCKSIFVFNFVDNTCIRKNTLGYGCYRQFSFVCFYPEFIAVALLTRCFRLAFDIETFLQNLSRKGHDEDELN